MPNHSALRIGVATAVLMSWAAGPAAVAGAASVTTRTKPFTRPPYYHGDPPASGTQVAYLAPVVAATPETPAAWLPAAALQGLAAAIDDFLRAESLACRAGGSDPLGAGGAVGAPTVYFGCELDSIGECDGVTRQNVLATSGGTRVWREWVATTIHTSGANHALVLELRLAPQWIHQKNISGKKEIRLGAGHVQELAWLTSLDSPVWVLQLTGARVDREGKVVASGAEGIWAVRTPFRASILRAERMMSDDEVDYVRTRLVRGDLPGHPLAWQVAVRQLVGALAPTPCARP